MTEENPADTWEEFPGKDINTLALPDYYSNYFDYAFDRTTGDAKYTGLRITGEFAYARYMSYNVYDANVGTSVAGKTDYLINPLPNNVNPFVPRSNAEAKNRSYVVNVIPNGYSTGGDGNDLTYDSTQINVLTVILRYYVPQVDDYGNVTLPTIEAFDVRTQRRVRLPTPYRLRGNTDKDVFSQRLAPIFATDVDDTLRFYHASGAGQFDNSDNIYLINAVTQGEDKVLLIRIKPPSYPKSNHEYGTSDVRYWSFNECDADTSTPLGVKDEDFKVGKDGFVRIAIGDDCICDKAEQRGYNFMPWKADRSKTVIVYRNLVTKAGYPGALQQVPEIEIRDLFIKQQQNIYDKDAKNCIGDYAPTGKKVSQDLFMLGSDEIESLGF